MLHSRNGNILVQVHCYGSTENVGVSHYYTHLDADDLRIRSRRRKEHPLVCYVPNEGFSLRKFLLFSSSTIIEDIYSMRKRGLALLAFFYCDFSDDQKKDRRGLLTSLLFQICDQSDSYCDILSDFYSTHLRGSQGPTDDALAQCLEDMLRLQGQAPVYIILGALDECPNTSAIPPPREKVLMLVEHLASSDSPNLHLCVTSRFESDIKLVLDPLYFNFISIHSESGQRQDIDDYVKSTVHTDPMMRKWNAADRQLVIDMLTRKADGM